MDDGFYHGINKLKKPATKVMAPPGGTTHFNIFTEPEVTPPKDVNKCQEARSKSSVFSGPAENNPSREERVPAKSPAAASASGPDSSHPSTKVLAPPGGKSNIAVLGSDVNKSSAQGEAKRQEKQHTPGPASHNIFGGGEEVIGQRAKNRKPPGGESHNIFG